MSLDIDPSSGEDPMKYSANETPPRKIEEHDNVVQVRDTKFAAALASIGIPLFDPPYSAREFANGEREVTWLFHATDAQRELNVRELLVAAHDPMKFIRENPQHVLTFALAMVMNLQIMQKVAAEGRAMITFALDEKRHIHVMKGSRKEALLRREGYKQV